MNFLSIVLPLNYRYSTQLNFFSICTNCFYCKPQIVNLKCLKTPMFSTMPGLHSAIKTAKLCWQICDNCQIKLKPFNDIFQAADTMFMISEDILGVHSKDGKHQKYFCLVFVFNNFYLLGVNRCWWDKLFLILFLKMKLCEYIDNCKFRTYLKCFYLTILV